MSNRSEASFSLYQNDKNRKLPVPIGKEIVIGRSRLTGIKDRRVSRNHLKVLAPKD